jgi:hypothetical protein
LFYYNGKILLIQEQVSARASAFTFIN